MKSPADNPTGLLSAENGSCSGRAGCPQGRAGAVLFTSVCLRLSASLRKTERYGCLPVSQEKPQPDPLIGQGFHPFCGSAPPLRGIHRPDKISHLSRNSDISLLNAGTEKRCPKQCFRNGRSRDSQGPVPVSH